MQWSGQIQRFGPRQLLGISYYMIWVVSLFQGFYEEVSSPLLLEVDLNYPDNTVDLLTKNYYSQLFNGSEIVVAGKLSDNDLDNFLVEVNGQGVRDGQ